MCLDDEYGLALADIGDLISPKSKTYLISLLKERSPTETCTKGTQCPCYSLQSRGANCSNIDNDSGSTATSLNWNNPSASFSSISPSAGDSDSAAGIATGTLVSSSSPSSSLPSNVDSPGVGQDVNRTGNFFPPVNADNNINSIQNGASPTMVLPLSICKEDGQLAKTTASVADTTILPYKDTVALPFVCTVPEEGTKNDQGEERRKEKRNKRNVTLGKSCGQRLLSPQLLPNPNNLLATTVQMIPLSVTPLRPSPRLSPLVRLPFDNYHNYYLDHHLTPLCSHLFPMCSKILSKTPPLNRAHTTTRMMMMMMMNKNLNSFSLLNATRPPNDTAYCFDSDLNKSVSEIPQVEKVGHIRGRGVGSSSTGSSDDDGSYRNNGSNSSPFMRLRGKIAETPVQKDFARVPLSEFISPMRKAKDVNSKKQECPCPTTISACSTKTAENICVSRGQGLEDDNTQQKQKRKELQSTKKEKKGESNRVGVGFLDLDDFGNPITNPLYKVYDPKGNHPSYDQLGKERIENIGKEFNQWLVSLGGDYVQLDPKLLTSILRTTELQRRANAE